MGELLHLPIVRCDDWTTTFEEVPMPDSTSGTDSITDCDRHSSLTPPERWALVVGAEGPGLSAETLARCTNVRIPMRNGVDSLNVGHAAGCAGPLTRYATDGVAANERRQAPIPLTSRSGTNSTTSNPTMRARSATPSMMSMAWK